MWVFNLFRYLIFWAAMYGAVDNRAVFQALYDQLVADGSPCYAWVGTSQPTNQPVCWYDGGQ